MPKKNDGQPKRGRGRPRKILNDEQRKRVLIGYQNGFNKSQIAKYVGVCENTLTKCLDENPSFKVQAEQQRMVACANIVRELRERAINKQDTTALIYLTKVWLGWTDRNHVVNEHKGEIKTSGPAKVELNVMYEDPIDNSQAEQVDENTGEVVEMFEGDGEVD